MTLPFRIVFVYPLPREDAVKTKIQKWGNSLGLRIPRGVAEAAGLESGSVVDVRVVERHIEVVSSPSLDDLLELVTSDNIHASVDDGGPIGREVI